MVDFIDEQRGKVLNRFDDLPEESKNAFIRVFELVDNVSSGSDGVKEVHALLEANHVGVNANIRALNYGQTLLNTAISHSYEMTKMLLEHHGANPNQKDMMDGQTPMDTIAEREEWSGKDEMEEMAEVARLKALLQEYGGVRSSLSQLIDGTSDDDEAESLFQSMLRGDDETSLCRSDTDDDDDDENKDEDSDGEGESGESKVASDDEV